MTSVDGNDFAISLTEKKTRMSNHIHSGFLGINTAVRPQVDIYLGFS